MYPAPITPTFFGRCSNAKKPSESIASSPPGTPSGAGAPPTAMTMCFAVMTLSPTCTVVGDVSLPNPSTRVTLSLSNPSS